MHVQHQGYHHMRCHRLIQTPSMSPHLPVTPEEIADAAVGAVEAGAAIVHLHARNPLDGRPDQSPEVFAPILRPIKQRSDAVVNLTTGGSPYMSVEERVRPAEVWKPEVASLNMGSMNSGEFALRFPKIGYRKLTWMMVDAGVASGCDGAQQHVADRGASEGA